MRAFFISEYYKDLENAGIDTVCFMGYGYSIEDVMVGAKFYKSYLYYGAQATAKNCTLTECLSSVLAHERSNGNRYFFDEYKLIQKYKFFDCYMIDSINKTTIPIRKRREHLVIKNLRSGEISIISDMVANYSHLFLWVNL